MARETVEAVRRVELNALQIEKDALQKRDAIIYEAEKQAKLLISSRIKKEMDKAQVNLAEAEQQGIAKVEAAKEKATEEIIVMKNIANKKEEEAIKLILSYVISDK